MNPSDIEISVVLPAYKCSFFIDEIYERLCAVLNKIGKSYEIIFINDSSPEEDWSIVKKLAEKDKRVRGINFSRNFGQHYAIFAGLERSLGKWVVVMDCDLQDRPEEIKKIYDKAVTGYDIVLAKRNNRKDFFIKKIYSKIFYKILSYLTETEQDAGIANFGIYRRIVVDTILQMKESRKYFPTMIRWVGFKSTNIIVKHAKRKKGKSSYNFKKSFDLALSVMISFSDKPLKIVTKLGFILAFSSFVVALFYFYIALKGRIEVTGWASLIISLWFLSGLIIFILGIIGIYISKIFDEVKRRPIYAVKDIIDDSENGMGN